MTTPRDDPSSPLFSPKSPTGVSLCNGCSSHARCRLGLMRETLAPDGVVTSEVRCPGDQQGGPNVAHGGWTAGIFDELIGHALLIRDEFAVTGKLTVNFIRPVPVETQLVGRTVIAERQGRKVLVSASLELVESGALLGTAEAIMIKRPAAHFAMHEEWLARQHLEGGGGG